MGEKQLIKKTPCVWFCIHLRYSFNTSKNGNRVSDGCLQGLGKWNVSKGAIRKTKKKANKKLVQGFFSSSFVMMGAVSTEGQLLSLYRP